MAEMSENKKDFIELKKRLLQKKLAHIESFIAKHKNVISNESHVLQHPLKQYPGQRNGVICNTVKNVGTTAFPMKKDNEKNYGNSRYNLNLKRSVIFQNGKKTVKSDWQTAPNTSFLKNNYPVSSNKFKKCNTYKKIVESPPCSKTINPHKVQSKDLTTAICDSKYAKEETKKIVLRPQDSSRMLAQKDLLKALTMTIEDLKKAKCQKTLFPKATFDKNIRKSLNHKLINKFNCENNCEVKFEDSKLKYLSNCSEVSKNACVSENKSKVNDAIKSKDVNKIFYNSLPSKQFATSALADCNLSKRITKPNENGTFNSQIFKKVNCRSRLSKQNSNVQLVQKSFQDCKSTSDNKINHCLTDTKYCSLSKYKVVNKKFTPKVKTSMQYSKSYKSGNKFNSSFCKNNFRSPSLVTKVASKSKYKIVSGPVIKNSKLNMDCLKLEAKSPLNRESEDPLYALLKDSSEVERLEKELLAETTQLLTSDLNTTPRTNAKILKNSIPSLTKPKVLSSKYKIINKISRSTRKQNLLVKNTKNRSKVATSMISLDKTHSTPEYVASPIRKNSILVERLFKSKSTIINKNTTPTTMRARMIKSKYLSLKKTPTPPNKINLTTKHLTSPTTKNSILVKRLFKSKSTIINKNTTATMRAKMIKSKHLSVKRISTPLTKIHLTTKYVVSPMIKNSILVKRLFKSKSTIINKNTTPANMRARMIKAKYLSVKKTPTPRHFDYKMRRNLPKYKGSFIINKYALKRKPKKIFPPHQSRKCMNLMQQQNPRIYFKNACLKKSTFSKIQNSRNLRVLPVGSRVFIRNNNIKKTPLPDSNHVASRVLHRSINRALTASAKKMTKVNTYCMFYNRFGRCNKGIKCTFIHDPSKIAVCTRFLRGTCKNEGCPFSHEKAPGKMAICSFFLVGACEKEDCPYRHENLAADAKLCKAFVQGYCSKGKECKKAHILICPKFIQGTCERGNSCPFPHPPSKIKKNIEKVENKTRDLSEDLLETVARYFEQSKKDLCVALPDAPECVSVVLPKRRKLEEQPSFIPL